MPRPKSDKKRGGQPKDTDKWAVSVERATIREFERVAGKGARKLAAKFLDDLAHSALRGMPDHKE